MTAAQSPATMHSSSSSSDEETGDCKLLLGISLVQDSLTALTKQVQRAERRLKMAKRRQVLAEKRATKWKRLYKELKDSQAATVVVKQEKEVEEKSSESEEKDERKPAASQRGSKRTRRVDASEEASNKKRRRDNSIETHHSSNGDSESDTERANPFDTLDAETKEWITSIGLKDSYGNRELGLGQIQEDTYVKPSSFEKVFLLTDFLFPVEDGEETYHCRLFKKVSRPGIKIRDKLRTIKRKNPNDPRVCWHETDKKWTPPTVEALTGLVRLIVES